MSEPLKYDALYTNIKNVYSATKSWQKTGERFGVNKAMARLLANGYKPGKKISKVLGLQEYAPAPVCPLCGNVHIKSTCPDAPKRPHVYRYQEIHGHNFRVTMTVKTYIDELLAEIEREK